MAAFTDGIDVMTELLNLKFGIEVLGTLVGGNNGNSDYYQVTMNSDGS